MQYCGNASVSQIGLSWERDADLGLRPSDKDQEGKTGMKKLAALPTRDSAKVQKKVGFRQR